MAGVWKKTLVYLGLAEDDELDEHYYDDPEGHPEEQAPPPQRRARRPAPEEPRREAVVRPLQQHSAPGVRFHLVMPSSFNDAQEVGDKFREGFSVLMNLQGSDGQTARRLVDFASGLAYGLGGSIQQAADNVFLIAPRGVQVSAEERRRFLEERGFFNQA